MAVGKRIKRWFRRRKERYGELILGEIERDLALELRSKANRLALEVSPQLDELVTQGILTPGGKSHALSTIAAKMDEAVPRWADDIVDRARRLLRLPDDD